MHAHAQVLDGLRLIPRTYAHSHKYINMQPVPLSACNHWQGGHSWLKKLQQRTGWIRGTMENMQWQSGGRKIRKRKKKELKKKGRRNLFFHFMDQSERGRVSESRHAGRGGFAFFACRWGMSQSVHAYMSVTEWWGEKNSRDRGEGGGFKEKKSGWQGRGTGGFLSVKDYQPHLSFYWFSFDVYGSKGNRHGANPN